MLQVAFCFSDFSEALSQSLWRGPQQRGCVFLPVHYLVCWLRLYGSWDFSIPFSGMAPMIFSQSRAQWRSICFPRAELNGEGFFPRAWLNGGGASSRAGLNGRRFFSLPWSRALQGTRTHCLSEQGSTRYALTSALKKV